MPHGTTPPLHPAAARTGSIGGSGRRRRSNKQGGGGVYKRTGIEEAMRREIDKANRSIFLVCTTGAKWMVWCDKRKSSCFNVVTNRHYQGKL